MASDRRAYYAEWAKKNREHLREYHKVWYEKNKPWLAEKARLYNQRPEVKERRRANEAKPEKRADAVARVLKWQKENPERVNAKNARWKKENPDSITKQRNARRARQLAAGGSYTAKEARELLVAQDYLCANPYCRADLRHVKRHLDHKVPLAKGGSNGIENLQWLCARCNLTKWAYDYHEWLAEQGESP